MYYDQVAAVGTQGTGVTPGVKTIPEMDNPGAKLTWPLSARIVPNGTTSGAFLWVQSHQSSSCSLRHALEPSKNIAIVMTTSVKCIVKQEKIQ